MFDTTQPGHWLTTFLYLILQSPGFAGVSHHNWQFGCCQEFPVISILGKGSVAMESKFPVLVKMTLLPPLTLLPSLLRVVGFSNKPETYKHVLRHYLLTMLRDKACHTPSLGEVYQALMKVPKKNSQEEERAFSYCSLPSR